MTSVSTPIHEAASQLGVSASTLRNWGEKLGVAGTRTSNGKRVYSNDELAVLETVKNLREQEAGWQTIRRHIGEPTAGHCDELKTHCDPTVADGTGGCDPTMPPQPFDTGAIIAAVVEAVTAQTDQSERYARATFEIGKLTSDNEHLRVQLDELKAKVALLEASKPARPWWKPWA